MSMLCYFGVIKMDISSIQDFAQHTVGFNLTQEESKIEKVPSRVVEDQRTIVHFKKDPNEIKESEAVPETREVESAVEQMNEFVQSIQRNLSFSIDRDTGHDVVTVLDSQTEEVIRQYPSDEFLKISKALGDIQGILFTDKV